MGGTVYEELTKIFRNKSDVLEEIFTELLDAESKEVYELLTDFKDYLGIQIHISLLVNFNYFRNMDKEES